MVRRAKPKPQQLTDREAKFALVYAQTRNQSEAARQAGYGKGWQRRAHEILARPHVQSAVHRHQKGMTARAERKATDVIDELGRVAFQDPASFLKQDEVGRWLWKAPDELTDEQRACIRSIRVLTTKVKDGDKEQERQEFRYTFHDKMSALIQLGRHHGLFDDKLTVSVAHEQFRKMSDDQLRAIRDQFKRIVAGDYIEGEVIPSGKVLPDDRGHR